MICPNCKNNISEDITLCPICNYSLNQSQISIQNNYQQEIKSNTILNKKSISKIILILISGLLLIILSVFLINKMTKKESAIIEKNDENAFFMKVEDVFSIENRGTVVTGNIEKGTIVLNDNVEIIDLNQNKTTATVTRIVVFNKSLNSATEGDKVALLLKDVYDIKKDYIIQSNVTHVSNTTTTNFLAKIYMYTEEEGGRQTPFFNKYRPAFYFDKTDIYGTITISDKIEKVSPGDSVDISVELEKNTLIKKGDKFVIREGGRKIAKGTVTKVK